MSERARSDPINDAAIAFMRRERLARKWSAEALAGRCEEFGSLQQPPIDSSLNRTRIAKLESGVARQLRVDELALLAGAFGVSLDDITTNSETPQPRATPAHYTMPRQTVLERLTALEGSALPFQGLLERLVALEDSMSEVQQTLGTEPGYGDLQPPANLMPLPEPSWAACLEVIRTPVAA
jgi:transcriptional regulator with XRE-family HTH domain